MTLWHAGVMRLLRESGLFVNVQLSGGKVRALLSETRFLDIHFDPTSRSYSYALIDLTLFYPGDKRILGWDDYPHPGALDLAKLGARHTIFKNASLMAVGNLLNHRFVGTLNTSCPPSW